MSEAHSKLPWGMSGGFTIVGSDGVDVCRFSWRDLGPTVVRAVNNHDKLVAIVERIAKADIHKGLAVLLESDAVDARALLEEVRGK